MRKTGMVLAILLSPVGRLAAETVNCTPINAVPWSIQAPGIYCLTQNLELTAPDVAIRVFADDVVLDFNGFTLSDAGGGSSGNAGVWSYDRKRITVKNGTIRGFDTGVFLGDTGRGISQGHVVDGIRLDQSRSVGVWVHGRASVVRGCHVVDTGRKGGSNYFGIAVEGPDSRVIDNDVINTGTGQDASAWALRLDAASGGVVRGNRVGNEVIPPSGWSNTLGVAVYDSRDVLVVDNAITVMKIGVEFAGPSSGKYRENLTSGVWTPFVGGVDAGNNN